LPGFWVGADSPKLTVISPTVTLPVATPALRAVRMARIKDGLRGFGRSLGANIVTGLARFPAAARWCRQSKSIRPIYFGATLRGGLVQQSLTCS
jgi:hypothetical protein